MQQFWRIIELLLILKVSIIYSNNCQLTEYNSICQCSRTISGRYDMDCPINSTRSEIDIRIEYFSEQIVTIYCQNNDNLLYFDHNISSIVKNVKILALHNCYFEEIKIKNIASLVGAENLETLQILNYKTIRTTFVTLHKNQFQDLTNLKTLEISDTRCNNLDEDLLEFIPNITTLILRNDQIKSIPTNFFQFTPKLKNIELGINKLKVFEDGTFSNLKDLLFLSLWRNELTNLSSDVFADLNSVETISLFSNPLTTLPVDIFHKNVNLKIINLSRNSFKNLPAELFQKNHHLKKLKLENELHLKTLPNGFLSNLTNLLEVKLDSSNLKSLPENLFEGSINLVNISLQKNHFVSLPAKIFYGLNKLERLELNDNKIENLDDKLFDSCINLKNLNINNNNIVTISEFTFSKLANLETLFMRRNKIMSIDRQAFYSLHHLKKTSFAFNNLTTVSVTKLGCESVFNRCNELEVLDLSYNKIQLLCDDWTRFPGHHFNFLNLSHNDISSLTVDDLDIKNQKDFTVDLSYNKITTVDLNDPFNENFEKRFNEEYRSTVVLLLNNNPIKCDCALYDFLRYLDGSMMNVRDTLKINTGPMKCSDSKKYEDILLSELNSKSFECIPPMEEINDFEMCPQECDQWTRPSDKTFIFNCSYRNLNQAPESLCSLKSKGYVKELDLTGNNITIIPNLQQTGYNNLSRLTLSHNQISTISTNLLLNVTLQKLELDNNHLTVIRPEVIEEMKLSVKKMKLGNNPWQCDCGAQSLQIFVNTKNNTVEDEENVICKNFNRMLTRIKIDELCPSNLELIVTASVFAAIFGLTFGLIASFYYRYQQEIKIWLYAKNLCLWFVTEEVLDKNKPYDAFISYSHKDEEFVINELMANLEKGPRSFKLCVHFRDWLAGEWIPFQIARSIRDSRRTIVVVSPNFIQSEWGKLEFRTAHKEALTEGRARIIVILYGDIGPVDKLEPDLQSYLTMNTYVQWGDPWFWNKLRYALPHKSDAVYNPSKYKNFNKAHTIVPLDFNKTEVKQFPESGLAPLNENGKVIIDMSDDECNKLNTRF
ncbi:protein toll-like [Leptopilina boulardi]|uniref:protein toll-like n=1 Tax=Leptopilina boulardi TaxID=63433 RepID=UPI0021F5CF1B|nr:protein toll-like [Leptopilina boulardi]